MFETLKGDNAHRGRGKKKLLWGNFGTHTNILIGAKKKNLNPSSRVIILKRGGYKNITEKVRVS